MNNIICIAGPTASGKTKLAGELAKMTNGEVVSCDSMQIYRKMDIGTAKPTKEEIARVPHHLIDICEPDEDFSAAVFAERAQSAIKDVFLRGKVPVLCGGTGLYLDALLRGGNSAPSFDTSDIRAKLSLRAENEGVFALYEELLRVDPESAASIHPNNVKRVIRALEIYIASGEKKSELDKRSKELESPYDARVIYLNYLNRVILYRRIDSRVDFMIKEGLVEETRALMSERAFELNRTASQAIGYKELFGFIEGRESLESAIENLKRATRRYAKRQITWFSAKDYILPLDADDDNGLKTFEEIVNNAKKLFSV